MELRCSCLRVELFGASCVHIVGVMVYLEITKLPKCLILEMWTKKAKKVVLNEYQAVGNCK